MVEPLYAGMQQLGLLPCRLVGFSFGGMTAGLLVAEHPDVAAQLVLVGAPAMGVTDAPQLHLKGWRHLPDAAAQREVHRYNIAELMLHDATLIDDETLALHEANVCRDRLPLRQLAGTDILARTLPRIACPVAAIYGAHDALYRNHMDALEAKYRAVTPHLLGIDVVADSGHWVQHERPTAFLQHLIRYLTTTL